MSDTPVPGSIVWQDLTVPDAAAVRRFYERVVGWTAGEHPMDGYSDYEIKDGAGHVVAGICHARGPNANIPPQWLIYIAVADVAAAARRCEELGGKVLDGPRAMGGKQFCVIQDPAGAVAALIG
jgi:uncharacterized protein